MAKKDMIDKVELVISVILKLLILNLVIVDIFSRRWLSAFVASVVLLFSFVPVIVERNFKIYVPNEFGFFTTLMLYLHYALGEIGGFYEIYPWYDKFLHYSGSFLIGFLGFFVIYTFYYTREIKFTPNLIFVFTFSFGLAIGALWEIFEFSMDILFNLGMQVSLANTMVDLMMDTVGSAVVAGLGLLYIKRAKGKLFDRIIKRFIEMNS